MRLCFVLIICFFFFKDPLSAAPLQTANIAHPQDPSKQIEIIISTLETKEKFPLVVLLHGSSMKNGAGDFNPKYYQFGAEKGIAVAAISLPGFGKSGGQNDFCGPFTMHALHAAIDHLKQHLPVTSVGIIGFGVGGLAATLLSSQRDDLGYVISANGVYDLSRLFDKGDMIRNVLVETGIAIEFTLPAIHMRSPMETTSNICCPMFLLHRKFNSQVREDEVMRFSDAVNDQGGDCTVVFLEGGEHDQKISLCEVIKAAGKWIEDHLD